MLKLLFQQSKFWFVLLVLLIIVVSGSASYLATASRDASQTRSSGSSKIDLSDRYSDLDLTNANGAQPTQNAPSNGISRDDLLSLIRPDQGCPRLQPVLYDMTLETYQERFALAHNIIFNRNKARVILVVKTATTSVPSGYLIDAQRRVKQNILADVPVYLLCSLANEKEIDQVRVPTTAELLDLSGSTGSVGISELLNKAKLGYTPTTTDFKRYNIDPELFYDLLKKVQQSNITVTQQN